MVENRIELYQSRRELSMKADTHVDHIIAAESVLILRVIQRVIWGSSVSAGAACAAQAGQQESERA